jgi:hypothetical protein
MKLFNPASARRVAFLPLIITLISSSASGALTVSPIFNSNMVLQRGTTVPVFGTADPGATVTVSFLGQNVSAVAAAGARGLESLHCLRNFS